MTYRIFESRCKSCNSPHRDEIEEKRLKEKWEYKEISDWLEEQYQEKITSAALGRHFRKHVMENVEQAIESEVRTKEIAKEEVESTLNLIDELKSSIGVLKKMLNRMLDRQGNEEISSANVNAITNCLLPNENVFLKRSIKSIEDVDIGDEVPTHKGKYEKVIKTFSRKINENILEINVGGLLSPTLKCTKEHPILSIKNDDIICKRRSDNLPCRRNSKRCKEPTECEFLKQDMTSPKWHEAKELERGDFVAIYKPNTDQRRNKKTIKVSESLPDENYIKYDDKLFPAKKKKVRTWECPNCGEKQYPEEGKPRSVIFCSRSCANPYRNVDYDKPDMNYEYNLIQTSKKGIQDKIEISNDFMKLVGYYLSEGCIIRDKRAKKEERGIQISQEMDSKWYDEIGDLFISVFGECYSDDSGHTFYSNLVGEFFKQNFGMYHDGKRIPIWVKNLPKEKILNLFKGLFRGDGYTVNNDERKHLKLVLCNRNLILDLWSLLNKFNFVFRITKHEPDREEWSTSYRLSGQNSVNKELYEIITNEKINEYRGSNTFLRLNNFEFRRISNIEENKYEGKVHNLEVSNDNSYIVNGVAVHNCLSETRLTIKELNNLTGELEISEIRDENAREEFFSKFASELDPSVAKQVIEAWERTNEEEKDESE